MIKVNAKLLAAVSVAQSPEKARYYLNGVYFDKDRIVATDGTILTMAKSDDMELPEETTIRVISKAARSAMKKPKADYVTIVNDTLTVCDDQGNFLYMENVKPVDAGFPEYMRVCPADVGEGFPKDYFSTVVLKKLIETSDILSDKKSKAEPLAMTGAGAGLPHLVHYGASSDIFPIAMPMLRTTQMTGYHAWFRTEKEG